MDRLNWSKLKTLYRVASCGSFARASERYNITPSALSKMIKSLEYELNCQLFIRTENGLELTPKGQLLYRDSIRIAKMLEFTESEILGNSNEIKNNLKLVAPVGLSTMYISKFINIFIESHPDISLEIISYDEMSLNDKLLGHVLINPFIKDLNGYKQEHLIDMELKLFSSREYLEKFGTPTTVEDLDHHRLIAFSRNKVLFVELNWHLRIGIPEGKMRIPVFEADATFGRCYLAHKGVGIISVPKQHPDVKKYDLVEVLPHISGPKYNYNIIVDDFLIKNQKVNSLAKFLKENFSAL